MLDFVDENTIAVNIRRLREKIEDNPAAPVYIKTVSYTHLFIAMFGTIWLWSICSVILCTLLRNMWARCV